MNNKFDQLAIYLARFLHNYKENSFQCTGWVVGFVHIQLPYLEGVPLKG